MPVGLVHAEHEGARDAVALHDPLEVVVVPDHSVDVVAEVEVRVEDVRIFGELPPHLLVPLGDQLLSALKRFVHRFAV